MDVKEFELPPEGSIHKPNAEGSTKEKHIKTIKQVHKSSSAEKKKNSATSKKSS